MQGFAERRVHRRERVPPSAPAVGIDLGGARARARVVDWSPAGLRLEVREPRAVRRVLDALRLLGAQAPCLVYLEGCAGAQRLKAAVAHGARRGEQALRLGLRLEAPASPAAREGWARCFERLRSVRAHRTERLDVAADPRRKVPASPAGAADPLLGCVVGPCRVEELLGQGSFGRVYRAQHLRLQRPVALKVLARHAASRREMRRFLNEARAAARLSDPNVAKVYELGADAEGRPYIVQELALGESLQERVERRGPLPLVEAATLGAGIAAGLEAIHGANLVHRDLKPENVMITADEVPKIVDFGLVRRAGDEAELTPQGQLLGTPAFLAPELIDRRAEGEAQAADLYALGCVLYYALTGRVPHLEEDPSGESLTVFLCRRVGSPAPDVRALRAGVPEPLARVVASLLAPVPSARCSAARARELLEAWARGEENLAPLGEGPARASGRRKALSSGKVRGLRSSRRLRAAGSRRLRA
ncbi:MAG: serine/threonine protein kinase, partial [Planctomycetota bacterium]